MRFSTQFAHDLKQMCTVNCCALSSGLSVIHGQRLKVPSLSCSAQSTECPPLDYPLASSAAFNFLGLSKDVSARALLTSSAYQAPASVVPCGISY